MSDGSEFQVCGAATENARRANSVRVLAADSSGARVRVSVTIRVRLSFSDPDRGKIVGFTSYTILWDQ